MFYGFYLMMVVDGYKHYLFPQTITEFRGSVNMNKKSFESKANRCHEGTRTMKEHLESAEQIKSDWGWKPWTEKSQNPSWSKEEMACPPLSITGKWRGINSDPDRWWLNLNLQNVNLISGGEAAVSYFLLALLWFYKLDSISMWEMPSIVFSSSGLVPAFSIVFVFPWHFHCLKSESDFALTWFSSLQRCF